METKEPATQQQLLFLEQHGYSPPATLTRIEAADLIRRYRQCQPMEHPGSGARTSVRFGRPIESRINPALRQAEKHDESYHLGLSFELSAGMPRHQEASPPPCGSYDPACLRRHEFWLDTCRELTQMHSASRQIHELYKAYGCRFEQPSLEEVKEILDALDLAMSDWELQHPELFFSTLELNFPELVKRGC